MASLSEAVASNDRRQTLVALRDKLATTIEATGSGRDIAALSKRLMEVCAELDSLPDPGAASNPVDDMRKKKRRG